MIFMGLKIHNINSSTYKFEDFGYDNFSKGSRISFPYVYKY